MKILPVNQAQSQQNFKGLWGKTESSAYAGDTVSNTVIVKRYYPFKDESKDLVDKIVRENSFHFEADWTEAGGISTYSDTSVSIQTLPFTKKEYDAYMSQKLTEETYKEPYISMEKYLRENGLKKYINKKRPLKWKLNDFMTQAKHFNNSVKKIFSPLKHNTKL